METRWMVRSLVCLIALFVPAVPATARDVGQSSTSSFRQELIDLQKAFVNAQERGDAEYVKNAVADDFSSIETNGGTSDKFDLVHGIHPPERPGPAPILYDFKVIELDEGCAIVTYDAVFPGSHMERYQHLSDTWVKKAGEWKLKFQQVTLNLWSAHDLD